MNNCRLGIFDWVGHPHPKRKLIRSVLINVMCDFGVSVRKANAKISAELTSHTSSLVFDVREPLCVSTSEQVRVVLCTCERVA